MGHRTLPYRYRLVSPGGKFEEFLLTAVAGYGLIALLNRRSRVRGQPRWTSWSATPSIASPAARRSSTSGLNRYNVSSPPPESY